MTVRVVHRQGSVGELHALSPFADQVPDAPEVWWCDPTDAAIVLGSRQRPDELDTELCSRAGLDVVRRRSGGGAVIVRPAEAVWVDLVLPAGAAPDDVRASMIWAGERWLAALEPWLDGRDDVMVHRGRLVDTAWSALVCWAGTGPGELVIGERKLVGLSQRRTRHGARVQGMVHASAPAVDIATLWSVEHPDAPVPAPVVLPGLDAAELARRLAATLA